MDAESELQLYEHMGFLDSGPISHAEATTVSARSSHKKKRGKAMNMADNNIHQRKGNYSKKPAINKEFSSQQLDPFELMFFPADYDPLPLCTQYQAVDDCNRKRNYLNKIKRMSNKDKRNYRAVRDLRYLHKNPKPHEHKLEDVNEESNLFCVHHLIGKCDKTACERVHQMREPRLFGVCKFFLTKSCVKGDSCEFMHSEFPCRYYYLDIDHPKGSNEDECQFSHGGPLNKEMKRYFKKQIEFWVKSKKSAKPDQFETEFERFIEMFDLKQFKLKEEYENKKRETIMIPRHSDRFTWENCLDGNQLELLKKNGIDSIQKINNSPVDLLLNCGLKMDQIYKITVSTCGGTRSAAQETIESDELDFENSSAIHSDTHLGKMTNETPQGAMEKDSYENMPGFDEQSESDATELQSECSSFQDVLEDFEMSDDSDTDNLVINENENDNEEI